MQENKEEVKRTTTVRSISPPSLTLLFPPPTLAYSEKKCEALIFFFYFSYRKNAATMATVVAKMRKACARQTSVAVSDATIQLQQDLKRFFFLHFDPDP